MAPFPLAEIFGHYGAYVIYLLVGISFGAVLEMAGFGISTKLAAQFYFKDQTVLKVMFTGILVAMVLVFWATGLGLLDYNRVWVNPTYLWPGIVGGLIMGFGFIIGGFCPGTSLVSAATLKIDGIVFILGVFTGIFIFGETVENISVFWNSSYLGRFTLQEWLGISTGTTVLLIIVIALFMFWGAEHLERIFGGKDLSKAPKARIVGAVVLLVATFGLVGMGQPTSLEKWNQISAEKTSLLENREVQIHPGELLDLINNNSLNLIMLDVRDETDYNLYHIVDARSQAMDELTKMAPVLLQETANTVIVTIDNDETRSTQAWQILTAESVPNVYILDGGINHWLDIFGHEGHADCSTELIPDSDGLRHVFHGAMGSRHESAEPDEHTVEHLEYVPKVKLEKRKPTGGGCG